MATQTSSASSVLDEIRALLVTKCEDPFDLDAKPCIGIVREGSNLRPCKKTRALQTRNRAKEDKLYFSELKEYNRDPAFNSKVESFIRDLYCSHHKEQAMGNFGLWTEGLLPMNSQEVTKSEPASSLDNVSTSVVPSIEPCPERSDYLPVEGDQTKESSEETEGIEDLSILTTSSTEPSTVSSPEDSAVYSSVTTPDSTFHELDDGLDNDYQEREESPEPDPEFENVLTALKNSAPSNKLEEVEKECNLMRRRSRIVHNIEKKLGKMDTEEGIVYALIHENGNIKVGCTAEQTAEQSLKHQHDCYRFGTVVYYQSSERFVGAYRVVTLVKDDLRDKRLVGTCDRCGHYHTGWLKADKDDVIKSIQNWTTLVRGIYAADGSLNEVGRQTMEALSPASSTIIVAAYKKTLEQHPIPKGREALPDAVIAPSVDMETQDVEPLRKDIVDHLSNESEASSDGKRRTGLSKLASKAVGKLKKFPARLSDRYHALRGKINFKEVPEVAQGAIERIFDQDVEVSTSSETGTKGTGIKSRLRHRSSGSNA